MTSVIEDIRAAAENSNRLPVLLANIKDALLRGRGAYHDLCLALAEAKALHPSTQGFSKWCHDNDVKLGKTDRAHAIEMGEWGSERLTAVLAKTHSTSLRVICEEGRVPQSGNCNQKVQNTTSSHKSKLTDAALEAHDRRKAAGLSISEEAIAAEIGTSITPVRKARLIRETEERVLAEATKIEDIVFSGSAQEKFDAKLRAYQKQLDLKFEARVRAEGQRRLDEIGLPHYFETLHTVEKLLEHKRGIIKRAEYNQLLKCVHPDTGPHVDPGKRADAFRILVRVEAKLVSDDAEQADLKKVSTLPKTREEMLARKRKVA